MQLQDVVVAKAFATDITAVQLLPGVRLHVHLQLLGAGEPLVAGDACVGFFSNVGPHVDHHLDGLDDGLVAKSALLFALIDSHVSVQLAAKCFVADFAKMRLFCGVRSVVPGQAGGH